MSHDGWYSWLASLPHTAHFFRTPRENNSRYGPGEQSSITRHCSSGFRECSRLRDEMSFTWVRPPSASNRELKGRCRRRGSQGRVFATGKRGDTPGHQRKGLLTSRASATASQRTCSNPSPQSDRTSAPRWPQAVQVNRSSIPGSRASSGRRWHAMCPRLASSRSLPKLPKWQRGQTTT